MKAKQLDDLLERLRDRLLKLPFHYIKNGESYGVELVEVDRMIRSVFEESGISLLRRTAAKRKRKRLKKLGWIKP